PAEEVGAKRVRTVEIDVRPRAVAPFGALPGSGDQALTLLPGRLREELLEPQPDTTGIRENHLVPPLLPAGAKLKAEVEAGVVVRAFAGFYRTLGPLEERPDVDPGNGRWNQAEDSQCGVAPADCRLAGKDSHGA